MADNVILSAGTSDGPTLATDEVTRAAVVQHVQYVKLMNGTDAAVDVIPGEATNGLDVDVTRLPALPAGANTIGAVNLAEYTPSSGRLPIELDAAALAALETITVAAVSAPLPAGTNNIGDVDIASIAAGDNNIGNVDVITLPGAAHDSAISGNPVRIAGRAITADYTSVTSGDTADLVTTLNGRLVVQPYSIPELTWSYAAASGGITNTTGVTAKAAGAAGIRNYITHVDVVNGHATVDTDVQIRDGAAGTVLWRGFAKAAGGGVSADFNPPLRGTAATLVEIACGTTGTATYFNLTGYTGP